MGKQEEETVKRLKDLAKKKKRESEEIWPKKKRESEEYAWTHCIKSVFCLSHIGKRRTSLVGLLTSSLSYFDYK